MLMFKSISLAFALIALTASGVLHAAMSEATQGAVVASVTAPQPAKVGESVRWPSVDLLDGSINIKPDNLAELLPHRWGDRARRHTTVQCGTDGGAFHYNGSLRLTRCLSGGIRLELCRLEFRRLLLRCER